MSWAQNFFFGVRVIGRTTFHVTTFQFPSVAFLCQILVVPRGVSVIGRLFELLCTWRCGAGAAFACVAGQRVPCTSESRDLLAPKVEVPRSTLGRRACWAGEPSLNSLTTFDCWVVQRSPKRIELPIGESPSGIGSAHSRFMFGTVAGTSLYKMNFASHSSH